MKSSDTEVKQKLQRLVGEINGLKRGGLDYQHPRFKEWKQEVERALAAFVGEGAAAFNRFKKLSFRSGGEKMWGADEDRTIKEREPLKRDLDKARVMLQETLEKV